MTAPGAAQAAPNRPRPTPRRSPVPTAAHPASELELERTYLADRLPDELDGTHPVRLVDVYVPEDPAVHPRLRLRRTGDRYELTKKLPVVEGDASAHHELYANGALPFQPDSVTTPQSRLRTRSELGRFELPSRPASTRVLLR